MGLYLLDTNAFTALYDEPIGKRAPRFRTAVWKRISLDQELVIPAYVLYEARRGLEKLQLRNEGAEKIARFDLLLRRTKIVGLDVNRGWFKAANLWAHDRLKGTNGSSSPPTSPSSGPCGPSAWRTSSTRTGGSEAPAVFRQGRRG